MKGTTSNELQKDTSQITILIADDDADDRMLTKEAFEENQVINPIHFVGDGEELMAYLLRQGKYADKELYPQPGMILLDLNMPRKDGREALAEIKSHPELRRIPVIVLTTSKAEEDVIRSYNLGVNCFITKPVTFNSLVEVTRMLGKYWFEIVELPPVGE
ncbi:MAG: response regulator [Solitalea sp.]